MSLRMRRKTLPNSGVKKMLNPAHFNMNYFLPKCYIDEILSLH